MLFLALTMPRGFFGAFTSVLTLDECQSLPKRGSYKAKEKKNKYVMKNFLWGALGSFVLYGGVLLAK